jgi:hypothetical protein
MTEKFDPNATPETDKFEKDGGGKPLVPWDYLREMEREKRLEKHKLSIEKDKITVLKSLVLEMLTDLEIQRDPSVVIIGKVVVHESKTLVANCLLRLILKQIERVGR